MFFKFDNVIFFLLQSFINQYQQFEEIVQDYDRRLATIICHGFDDATGLESAYKVRLELFV